MFNFKDKEDENISEFDEEPLQFKPHQPRFMTPLCHVTASSASDELLVMHTPATKDIYLKALVDSGPQKTFVPTYTSEKKYSLRTHSSAPFEFD